MQGNINVQTENIFPVIKKFLYSDHEIFLRELVSNAVDATQKLRSLSSRGAVQGELGDLTVQVAVDNDAKTLTITDRGIGMSADEVEKYINQIAFSGASDFLEKYKDVQEKLIGHFGMGFYSAFMVADKVEIFSKSYTDAPAVHWICDGSPSFTMDECEKSDRGTAIVLHIADDCKEFLEEHRILDLLRKYCHFMPVAIRCGDETEWVDSETEMEEDKDYDGNVKKDENGNTVMKPKRVEQKKPRIINNTEPAWRKRPSDMTEEDYKAFYHDLYPMQFEEPLFHIHLNVDEPFTLTGILYFPKIRKTIDPNRNKIQLYCNQVFVTDSVEGIVPDYLMLLHGVLDSPDIPLNVSRSYLQSDGQVKKLSAHISKKVAEKLESMFKNEREDFEKKWEDIRIFVEYGMLTDEKFKSRAMKFYLVKDTDGKYYDLASYRDKIKALQTDKNKDVCYIYTTDAVEQHAYIAKANEKSYSVLDMNSPLTPHVVGMFERDIECGADEKKDENDKQSHTKFVRVDADVIEKLIEHEDSIPEKLTKEEQDKLKPVIEAEVDKGRYTVKLESLEAEEMPMVITQDEWMRRYREMAATSGGMNFYGDMPERYNLVVNINHPLVEQVLRDEDQEHQKQLVHQLTDLALLSNGLLKGEALTKFVQRSLDIIK